MVNNLTESVIELMPLPVFSLSLWQQGMLHANVCVCELNEIVCLGLPVKERGRKGKLVDRYRRVVHLRGVALCPGGTLLFVPSRNTQDRDA